MDALLDAVAQLVAVPDGTLEADGWRVARAAPGWNGLVFRAEEIASGRALAVKLCRRDDRQRAGREYAALTALHEAGACIAAQPVALVQDRANLPGDAVIAAWLPGQRLEAPPMPGETERWRAVLAAHSEAHRIMPGRCRMALRPAVLGVRHPADLLAVVRERFARIPPQERVGALRCADMARMMDALYASTPEQWETPAPQGLLHGDANHHNFLADGGAMRVVDWENAGWSDPALDVADLSTHPQYIAAGLSDDFRRWLGETHGALLGDADLVRRAALYERIMVAFWVLSPTLFLCQPKPTLTRSEQFPPEHYLRLQEHYWPWAVRLFGL